MQASIITTGNSSTDLANMSLDSILCYQGNYSRLWVLIFLYCAVCIVDWNETTKNFSHWICYAVLPNIPIKPIRPIVFTLECLHKVLRILLQCRHQTMYLVIVPLLHDIMSTKGKLNAFWVAYSNTQQHFCWRNKTWVELCKILTSTLHAHLRSLPTPRLCLFDTARKCYRFSISKYNDWRAKRPPKIHNFPILQKDWRCKILTQALFPIMQLARWHHSRTSDYRWTE